MIFNSVVKCAQESCGEQSWLYSQRKQQVKDPIPNLDRYRHKTRLGYFQDLPSEVRQRSYQWLNRFIKRREATHCGVPGWLFAIYCGQAKRLALSPPTSSWGRSMRAKRGGLAVQRRYRLEGRDATARATPLPGAQAEC
jgi:hypothetical protein